MVCESDKPVNALRRTFSFYKLFLWGGVLLLVLCWWQVTLVRAADGINRLIAYQGKLLNGSGVTVNDNYYAMRFSLYSTETGSSRIWTATGTLASPGLINTYVKNGLFTVYLGDTSSGGGSQNALDINWNSDSLYLGVTVGNEDGEMSPRRRLTAAPYAINSSQLQGMYASGTASGGQVLFTINQTENNAATSARSSLDVRSKGTSSVYDFLLRLFNDLDAAVFSVNRDGSVTSTGYLAVTGSNTSTFTGPLAVRSMVSSTRALVDTTLTVNGDAILGNALTDNIYLNGTIGTNVVPWNSTLEFGSQTSRWLMGYFTNVSSTYVSTSRLDVTGLVTTSTFSDSVSVMGRVSSSQLAVDNPIVIFGAGTSTIINNLSVAGRTSSTRLSVENPISVFGAGTSTFIGSISAAGRVSSTHFSTENAINVLGSGTSTYIGSVSVSGRTSSTQLSVENPISILGAGTSTYAGSLSVSGRTSSSQLTVENLFTILGVGTSTISGNLSVFGRVSSSQLNVEHPISILGSGTSTWADSISVMGRVSSSQLTVDNIFHVAGAGTSTIVGNLSVMARVSSSRVSIDELLLVDGITLHNASATFNGNVHIGDSVQDVLTIASKINGTLQPNGAQYNLGTANYPWNDGFMTALNVVYVTSTHTTTTYLDVRGRAEMTNSSSTYATTSYLAVTTYADITRVSSTNATTSYLAVTTYADLTNVSSTNATTSKIFISKVLENLATATSSFTFVSTTMSGNDPSVMAMDDSVAVIVNTSTNALSFINLTNPDAPNRYATLTTNGGGTGAAIALAGGYAYITHLNSSYALEIVDYRGPAPVVVGYSDTPSSAADIAVQGRYAYFARNVAGAGLTVMDVGNVIAPKLVSSFTNAAVLGVSDAVAISGHYVYVHGVNTGVVLVIDATDPVRLSRVGSIAVGATVKKMVIQGSYLYLATSAGWQIIDISVPTAPVDVVSINLPTSRGIAVSGRYVYVTDITGVHVYDVSQPTTPVKRAFIALSNSAAIMTSGRYFFVTQTQPTNRFHTYRVPSVQTAGLEAFSADIGLLNVLSDGRIANRLSVGGGVNIGGGGLLSQGSIAVSATNTTSSIIGNLAVGTSSVDVAMHAMFAFNGNDLFVEGNIAAVSSVYTNASFVAGIGGTRYSANEIANDSGSFVVTTTGAFNAYANTTLGLRAGTEMNLIAGLGITVNPINGQFLPATDGGVALGTASQRFDLMARFSTTTAGTSTAFYAASLNSATSYINSLNGASVTSVSISSDNYSGIFRTGYNIPTVLTLTIANSPDKMILNDRHGVILNNPGTSAQYTLLDVSSSSKPFIIGQYTSGGTTATDFDLQGRFAYFIHNGDNSLRIYDLSVTSTLGTPRNTASLTTGFSNPRSIDVQGRYAYVADGTSNQLVIVDVGDPYAPRVVSSFNPGYSNLVKVVVDGRFAYVESATSDITIAIDVLDPFTPTTRASTATVYSQEMVIQGNYLFAGGIGGLDIIKANDPDVLATQSANAVGNIRGMFVAGRYLYLATATFIRIYDIQDVRNPVLVNTLGSSSAWGDVAVRGKYLYATDRTNGTLQVFQLPGAEVAGLMASVIDAGYLQVQTNGLIGHTLDVGNDISVGIGGIHTYGPIAVGATNTTSSIWGNLALYGRANLVTASSQLPLFTVQNTASYSTSSPSWSIYTDRLLVGNTSTVTGTEDYAMIISHSVSSSNRTIGLCVTSDAFFCPDAESIGAALPTWSIITENAIAADKFDLAEMYDSTDEVVPGDVLVLDSAASMKVKKSDGNSYDRRTIGVVSTNPGFVLGVGGGTRVALTGRVPTKVSTINGAINVGDVLATSPYPGVAMKATKPGATLGYALQNAETTSTIEVFVNIGYNAGMVLNTDGNITRIADDLVVDARGTATVTAPAKNSWGVSFRGSAWDGTTAQSSLFTVMNSVQSVTSSKFTVLGNVGAELLSLSQGATMTVMGDVVMAGRLYPSARGQAQTSKYIFLDDSSPSSTYMATNADGWQANDAYDFAERYYSPDHLEAGDLVMASDRGKFHVQRSLTSKEMLMGIISTRPAFVAGAPGPDTYPVALAGRVPTKVSAMQGAIKVGDPLAPSSIPGVAVKATEAGPIVGLALEAFDGGVVGKIEVFVNPGWWGGGAVTPTAVGGVPVITAPTLATPAAGLTTLYRGFATIKTGSKKVHVTYDSLLSFPNVQITPRGQVNGGWYADGYTDVGFDVILNQIQTRDVTFAWIVQGTAMGERMFQSDGTWSLVNPTTGEAVVEGATTSSVMEVPEMVTMEPVVSTVVATSTTEALIIEPTPTTTESMMPTPPMQLEATTSSE